MKKEKKGNQFIKKPYYEGGNPAMKEFVGKHLIYPKAAIAQKVEGTVFVRYTINHKGKVIAAKIISGIGKGCDEEAIRLVRLLEFIAPKNRNIKALFHKNIQIHFRLPKMKIKETPQLPASAIQYNYTPTKKEPKLPDEKEETGKSYDIIIRW